MISRRLITYRFHVEKNISQIKRSYCENSNKSSKKNEETSNDNNKEIQKINSEANNVVPQVELFQPTKMQLYRSALMHQLAHLSPVSSRTGKLIWLLVIFVIIIALWNADNIADNQRRKRIMYYDRLFFEKEFTKLLGLTSASILDDNFSEDHYFRGLVYFMLNDHEKALLDFKNVCERPDSHLAHISSGLTYSCFSFIAFGKYHEALSVAEDSININPHSSVAYKGKAEALMGLGRLKEALNAIDQSLSIDPDNIGCLTQKIFIYQRLGKHEEALQTIDQILLKDMFDRETHKNKVRVLFNLNRFDRAVNEIEVIESLFGTSCYNYYLKADALFNLGKYEEALLNIENALFVNQGNFNTDTLKRISNIQDTCRRNLRL